jgi:hypothetical protein
MPDSCPQASPERAARVAGLQAMLVLGEVGPPGFEPGTQRIMSPSPIRPSRILGAVA